MNIYFMIIFFLMNFFAFIVHLNWSFLQSIAKSFTIFPVIKSL
jgi:hypothetical protein